MKALIGLSGYARSGKDTVAAVLRDQHDFRQRAFADALRSAAYLLDPYVQWGTGHDRLSDLVDTYGWEAVKAEPDVRRLLQRFGTDVARFNWGNDFWVQQTFRFIEENPQEERWVISDVRFPNEADAILDAGGKVYRVVRPGYGPINPHGSETAMDCYEDFDDVIHNDGTLEDLHLAVGDATGWVVA